jgi:hypothetical protein
VVVADVDLVEGVTQRGDHPWMTVPEVEDAAVAVAVVEATAVERVPEERSFAASEHEVDAELLEDLDLAARDVLRVRLQRVGAAREGLRWGNS